jgi:hypothetical protein
MIPSSQPESTLPEKMRRAMQDIIRRSQPLASSCFPDPRPPPGAADQFFGVRSASRAAESDSRDPFDAASWNLRERRSLWNAALALSLSLSLSLCLSSPARHSAVPRANPGAAHHLHFLLQVSGSGGAATTHPVQPSDAGAAARRADLEGP